MILKYSSFVFAFILMISQFNAFADPTLTPEQFKKSIKEAEFQLNAIRNSTQQRADQQENEKDKIKVTLINEVIAAKKANQSVRHEDLLAQLTHSSSRLAEMRALFKNDLASAQVSLSILVKDLYHFVTAVDPSLKSQLSPHLNSRSFSQYFSAYSSESSNLKDENRRLFQKAHSIWAQLASIESQIMYSISNSEVEESFIESIENESIDTLEVIRANFSVEMNG